MTEEQMNTFFPEMYGEQDPVKDLRVVNGEKGEKVTYGRNYDEGSAYRSEHR